jgi:Ser/Thr protein kinase RdoA (MazF antagonist)
VTISENAQISSQLIARIERHWPIGRVSKIQRIERGLINQTFRVAALGGRRYVLRLYDPEIPMVRIGQEHALLEQLERVGFPLSPRLIAPSAPPTWKSLTLPGAPCRTMALMTHLPGEDRYTWDAPPQRPAAATALGVALARYHQSVWGWLPAVGNIAAREVDGFMRLGTTLGSEHQAMAALEALIPALADLDRSHWPVLMVHGDYHAANVRWAGGYQEDRVRGIFDFEYAGPNWRLYDVGMACAYLATGWADEKPGAREDGRLNVSLLAAFVSGYDRGIDPEGPLPRLLSGEKAALPHYLTLAHLLTLEWVLAPATRSRLGATTAHAYARHARSALTWLQRSDASL